VIAPSAKENKQFEAIHKDQVKDLKSSLGNVALDDITIKKACKKLFGDKFVGVLMQNSPIPLRDGYFIINTDFVGGAGLHWMAVVKKSHNVYIFDSFGRRASNILSSFTQKMIDQGFKIHNTDLTDSDQRGYTSVDCGHRSISALKIHNKYGLKAYMSL
jgi:hypothetical protein